MTKNHRDSRKKKKASRATQATKRHRAPGRPVLPSVVQRLVQQQWPLHEVLISSTWKEVGALAQILVSRQSPTTTDLVAGLFLVDLGCLGAKNGFQALLDPGEYRQLVDSLQASQSMISCDLDLAAKVLMTGLEYAHALGFDPHPDAVDAFSVLHGADASACGEEVPVGDGTGKPLYIAGPDDNVRAILKKLERAVGPEGFDLTLGPDEL